MNGKTGSIRNKLMVACALVVAAVLATPAAMAHDHYRGHGDHSGDVLGALVVGAVIGGVLVSASEHHDRYYDDGGYYSAPAYPQQGYYGGYPAAYSYPSYPTYSYGNDGYYNYPSGGGVSVGVVYSNHDSRWRGRDGRYYGGSRGYYRGNQGYYGRGDRGRYYSRHDH